ncbi:MAG TPA: phospholipase D-like domain-containing protein [Burkholderiaceae bacterium]|nr:phospholipase D-like domain-containing protein [Burkholderiaceae bacterium]
MNLPSRLLSSTFVRPQPGSSRRRRYLSRSARERGASPLARLASAISLGLLAACTTFPTVLPETANAAGREHEVSIDGAHGPLSDAARQRVLARLGTAGQDTSILGRHLAFEEEITGTPLSAGNKADLLQDGPATYQAMFDAMAHASSTIDMETYIFEDDEVGQRFAHELEAAAARGLTVNLIYDSVGSIGTPRAFFDGLAAHGVHTLEFNPVNPLTARTGWEVNQRDHRKLTVIDGKVAFLGGINISSVYSGGSFSRESSQHPGHGQKVPWRDTDLRVEGPAAADFQHLFVETWARQVGAKGPALAPADYFPPLARVGDVVVRAIGGTPTEPYSQIYATLISALRSSETSILLANAYFDPDPQLLQALEDAARRGVDVQLLLPTVSDTWMVEAAGRRHFGELLEAGAKIYQRKGALLHSKTTLIDGVWAAVGSTNLDWRSFLHNDEIDAIVLSADFGDRMKSAFERDLAQSTPLTLQDWRGRPLGDRLQETLAGLWEYWL